MNARSQWHSALTMPKSGRFLILRLSDGECTGWSYPRVACWSSGAWWADNRPLPIPLACVDEWVWTELPPMPEEAA